ncbi:MAG: hypothetical protein F4Z69_02120 [Bacteroidetes bacterium SB0668_bin_1]|nr:hypothetical protein [Bacteroidetes bacterium SB0668_bin_1]
MIDTLSIVESLTDAGVEQKQAKAHAQAIANAVSEQRKDSVMHSDIADLKAGIDVNKEAILANRMAIDANKEAILANGVAIDANKEAILANGVAINANKAAIIENKAAIIANKAGIDALKWMVGVNMAITLALFAVVLAG